MTGARASAANWRDPRGIVLGTILVTASAWAWVSVLHPRTGMAVPEMPGMSAPTAAGGIGAFIAAWGSMMAAMMIPSAMPMFFLYRTVYRAAGNGEHAIPPEIFAAVYLVVWTMTGIPVYGGYRVVAHLAATAPGFGMWVPYVVAITLVAAGLYQWTDFKRSCLAACESPLDFLMSRWRNGYLATLRLAFRHAAFCIGCCWGLMLILVVAGAMGIRWVIAIATLVLLEKLASWGGRMSRLVGAAFILLGAAVAIWPALARTIRS